MGTKEEKRIVREKKSYSFSKKRPSILMKMNIISSSHGINWHLKMLCSDLWIIDAKLLNLEA